MRKNRNVAKRHLHTFAKDFIKTVDGVEYIIRRCLVCHRCLRLRKDKLDGTKM